MFLGKNSIIYFCSLIYFAYLCNTETNKMFNPLILTIMAKKFFTNVVEDYEKNIIATMCEAVESHNITAIAANNKVKFIQPTKTGFSDWTYNFIRFGFAKSAKNNPHLARLNKYVPYQDISSTLAHFLNTAVEYGFYTRKTSEKFDGGENVNVIWME